MTPPPRLFSRGFTLMELLIVIAIIAVLLILAIPMLGKVRRQSEAVRCGNNLRQLGQAAALFSADNGNAIVPYALNRPFVTQRYTNYFWYAILYPYLGFPAPYNIENIRASKFWKDSPFYCTSNREQVYTINRICGWNNDTNPATHPFQRYLKVGRGYAERNTYTSAKYGTFERGTSFELPGGPSRTAYFLCGAGAALTPDGTTPTYPVFRHDGYANVLFMDGHVERRQEVDLANNPDILKEDDEWVFLYGRPAR